MNQSEKNKHLDFFSNLWPLIVALATGIAFFFDLQARLDLFQLKLDYTNQSLTQLTIKIDKMENHYYTSKEEEEDAKTRA